MSQPKLIINADQIRANYHQVRLMVGPSVKLYFVMKGLPEEAKTEHMFVRHWSKMEKASFADSTTTNIEVTMATTIPYEEPVTVAGAIVPVSDVAHLGRLGDEAIPMIMIEMGDLREGVEPDTEAYFNLLKAV